MPSSPYRAIHLITPNYLFFDSPLLNTGAMSFGIDAVVKIIQGGSIYVLLFASSDTWAAVGSSGYQFGINSDLSLYLVFNDGGGGSTVTFTTAPGVVPINQYVWLRANVDRSAGIITIYVNGLSVGAYNISSRTGSLAGVKPRALLFGTLGELLCSLFRFDVGRSLSANWHLAEWNRIQADNATTNGFSAVFEFNDSLTDVSGERVLATKSVYPADGTPGQYDFIGGGALTTLANVKAWLGLTGNTDDALLSRLLVAAGEFIKSYINRDLWLMDYIEVRDGHGGNSMILANFPVTEITSLTIDGISIPAAPTVTSSGYLFAASKIALIGYRFNRGIANVVIAYSAGFPVIPMEIEQACLELVGFKYRERDRIGHASKSLAGETVNFITTAMPDNVKTLLAQYKKVIPV